MTNKTRNWLIASAGTLALSVAGSIAGWYINNNLEVNAAKKRAAVERDNKLRDDVEYIKDIVLYDHPVVKRLKVDNKVAHGNLNRLNEHAGLPEIPWRTDGYMAAPVEDEH